jgi:hypothetical protein
VSARIAQRRTKVASLLAMCLGTREIAVVVKVSERTVRDDVVALREEGRIALREATALSTAGDYVARQREVQRRGWLIAQRGNDRTAVAALNTIRASMESELAALQALGIVYKRPLEVEIRERMLEQFASKPLAVLQRIVDARTETEFRAAITDGFGADAAAQFLLPSGEVEASGEVAAAGELAAA